MWENIKVIGWDVDATLFKNPKSLFTHFKNESYKRVAKRHNLSPNEAKKLYTKTYKEVGSNTDTFIKLDIGGRKGIRELLSKIDYSKFIKDDPKIRETFNKLKKFKHVILTNTSKKATLNVLKTIGLSLNVFTAVITAEDLEKSKPNPEAFLKITEVTKVKPEECVYIGDRDNVDIVTPKKLGMKTILVWGESKSADVSLRTVYEIPELFKL